MGVIERQGQVVGHLGKYGGGQLGAKRVQVLGPLVGVGELQAANPNRHTSDPIKASLIFFVPFGFFLCHFMRLDYPKIKPLDHHKLPASLSYIDFALSGRNCQVHFG